MIYSIFHTCIYSSVNIKTDNRCNLPLNIPHQLSGKQPNAFMFNGPGCAVGTFIQYILCVTSLLFIYATLKLMNCHHNKYRFSIQYSACTLVIVAAKMIGRRRRMTPEEDAIESILLGRDKPFLEARFIDTFKGKVFMSYSIILMPF